MEGPAWSRGKGWRVRVSKVFIGAEVAEVSGKLFREQLGCKTVAFEAEELLLHVALPNPLI